MILRRILAGSLLAGILLTAFSGCGAQNPYKFRAKVTVFVDTPDGVRSGSSVYEVWANYSYPGTTRRIWGQRGEAVAVDLPNGQTLFALLTTGAIHGDVASMVLATLDPEFNNTMVESTQKLVEYQFSETRAVALQNYPMLVTFENLADPTSVNPVKPDDLAKNFGPQYQMKAITVEVTDEPVTVGIEKRLGWLEAVGRERSTLIPNPPKYLDEIIDPVQQVTSGYFSTELYK